MKQNIVLYMPAYHKGYEDFFAKFPSAKIYVLNLDYAYKLLPQLERDMRAVPAEDIVKMLVSLGKRAEVLTSKTEIDGPIVMPREDISSLFANKYKGASKIAFESIHLRWDKWASTKEASIKTGSLNSSSKQHSNIMKKVLAEASNSPDWWRQVGAALVKDGKIILIGHNRPHVSDGYKLNAYGDPRSNFNAGISYDLTTAEHGEAYLIGLAARRGIKLEGCDIYVTTFPCPTCAKLIATAGIKSVYFNEGYSLVDANELFEKADIKIIQVKP